VRAGTRARTSRGLVSGVVALLTLATLVPGAAAHDGGWSVERRSDASSNTWGIQYLLRSYTFDLTVDGLFGPQTEDRVRRFQQNWGLTVDGIVGPRTWRELVRDADRRHDGVRAIQSRLNANGYGLCVDGVFGPKTEQAVRDFQRYHGLAVDGIVGQGTWQKLVQRLGEEEYPAGRQPC
jgi:peptidoglycan hydrolase-like protein with peptidoglycan-binding domain